MYNVVRGRRMVYSVVVRDKVRWRLLVRKLSGKEEVVVDAGTYLKVATGDDYPSLSLSGDTLVYNTTLRLKAQPTTPSAFPPGSFGTRLTPKAA